MDVHQIKLSKMDVFCYVIGDSASQTCALVDPAFDTGRILDYVKNAGYTATHVINTHSHPDHTGGNASIIRATGAKLLIHKMDAGALGGIFHSSFTLMFGGKPSPKADILLDDEDTIMIGKTPLKILHTPGHTPGGICIYAEGNLFTGDTLFVGGIGRTDLPGGSMKKLIGSIRDRILTLPGDTRVWPGHDYGAIPYSTVEDEKSNPYLK